MILNIENQRKSVLVLVFKNRLENFSFRFGLKDWNLVMLIPPTNSDMVSWVCVGGSIFFNINIVQGFFDGYGGGELNIRKVV